MFVIGKSGQKPVLDYPCRWVYKIIGSDRAALREAVARIIPDGSYTITPSNSSATGRYHCLNVEMVVADESTRTAVYESLRDHPAIRMVL